MGCDQPFCPAESGAKALHFPPTFLAMVAQKVKLWPAGLEFPAS